MEPTPSPQPNLQSGPPQFSGRFWIVIALTGIAAGAAGALLMRLLHAVESAAWPPYRSTHDFLDAVRRVAPGRRLLLLALAALLAGCVRLLLSRRKMRGHGGDVVEAIWLGSGRIPLARTLVNSILSIVVVGLGAAMGREGSIKHAGAAFASRFSIRAGLTPAQRRLAVACGAGAGLAAAYNVPFGGALFAMEVLLGSLALPQVVPALAASLLGTAASWILLPNRPVYAVTIDGVSWPDFCFAAIAGPLLGLAAVGYIRAIAWADRQTHRGWRALLAPMAALLGLGCLSVAVPEALGNGKDVVQAAFDNRFSFGLVLVLPFIRFVATTGCLAGGVPGGLFTPTLTCGATLSCLFFRLAGRILPGEGATTCVVVGAGAFLAAAMEGPVSTIVLLLELTHHIQALMVPLMLGVAEATLVARFLEPRSIYSARIRVRPSGEVVARNAAPAA